MFEMFKGMGQMADMLRNLPRIREQVEQMQQRLGQLTAEGDAGAGMVKAKINGRMELQSVTLSDEALKLGDRELLEDLIRGAVNQAISLMREQVAAETGKMASNLGLPPGMGLPGLG
ncbi:MAG: YbaB/EbfC family nucleoid-associated protein [Gemmataceae bacterium]